MYVGSRATRVLINVWVQMKQFKMSSASTSDIFFFLSSSFLESTQYGYILRDNIDLKTSSNRTLNSDDLDFEFSCIIVLQIIIFREK